MIGMGGSAERRFGGARALSLVGAVLLIVGVAANGWWLRRDSGPTPVLLGENTLGPGTALPDGLRVEPGSRLLGGVFATNVSPADESAAAALRERDHDPTPRWYWHAPLVLEDSPGDVFDRYVTQIEAAGYRSREGRGQGSRCGVGAVDDDLMCWSGRRGGDRLTAPRVAVWIRGRHGLLDAGSVAADVGADGLPIAVERGVGGGDRTLSIPNHGFLPLPKDASLVHGPVENLPPGLRTDIRFVIAFEGDATTVMTHLVRNLPAAGYDGNTTHGPTTRVVGDRTLKWWGSFDPGGSGDTRVAVIARPGGGGYASVHASDRS